MWITLIIANFLIAAWALDQAWRANARATESAEALNRFLVESRKRPADFPLGLGPEIRTQLSRHTLGQHDLLEGEDTRIQKEVKYTPKRRPGVALRRAQLENESLAKEQKVAGRIERNTKAIGGQ